MTDLSEESFEHVSISQAGNAIRLCFSNREKDRSEQVCFTDVLTVVQLPEGYFIVRVGTHKPGDIQTIIRVTDSLTNMLNETFMHAEVIESDLSQLMLMRFGILLVSVHSSWKSEDDSAVALFDLLSSIQLPKVTKRTNLEFRQLFEVRQQWEEWHTGQNGKT